MVINVSTSNTLNSTDQTITNKVETSVGVDENNLKAKAYVSVSQTESKKGSNTAIATGVKVEVPVYKDGKKKLSIGAQTELIAQ